MEKDTLQEQLPSQKLKVAIIIVLLFSGIFYFLFLLQNTHKPQPKNHNHTVIFSNNTLTVFDDKYDFANTPNKLSIHEDYFLVRLPLLQKTIIYSLKQEKIVKTSPFQVLDFDGKNTLYYKNGIKTYYNETDLGVNCSTGYIQDPRHILCVVPKKTDNLDNKLISIDPKTGKHSDIYIPESTISAIGYINNTNYIGEYNLKTKQFYIIAGNVPLQADTLIDNFYTLNGTVYFSSFPNGWNNKTASYGSINGAGKDIKITTIKKGEIIFKK